MTAEQNKEQNGTGAAVYIPFRTFVTAVDTLQQALPRELDPSVWRSFSGGTRGQTMSAFKFLRLVDADGTVQPILTRLVDANVDERRVILKEILRSCYGSIAELANVNASSKQLSDAMRAYNVAGGTLDKAIRFFLDAAEFAELPISPHWSAGRRTPAAGARTAKKKNARSPAPKKSNGSSTNQGEQAIHSRELASGGNVTLSMSINPITLTPGDRQWLFEVIDAFQGYPESVEQPEG